MTDEPFDRWPCGCKTGVVGDAFVIEPCGADCEIYNYALTQMAKQGKPIRPMIDPAVEADRATRFLTDIERRVRAARGGPR